MWWLGGGRKDVVDSDVVTMEVAVPEKRDSTIQDSTRTTSDFYIADGGQWEWQVLMEWDTVGGSS